MISSAVSMEALILFSYIYKGKSVFVTVTYTYVIHQNVTYFITLT